MYKIKQKMCKGDFVYWKCFLDASSSYFFSNVAPEFTVIANWQVAGFRALVQPSDPGVRYPQTTVSPNIKSFTIVRVMFIVTRSQIMEHSQTLKDESNNLFAHFNKLVTLKYLTSFQDCQDQSSSFKDT